MMDCTDRHDRYFLRLMCKNVMLYSEMVATKSAIHGDRKKILSYSPEEKPLALQVGGSDKAELAEVAKIAEDMGYDEININLGCPSKKVQKNMFGACLMREPDLVAECINSMVNACKIPVTAKTRIGFDDTEEFDYLNNFILKMKGVGCSTFILHARKAILTGMSPKQNLNIPKLNYGMVVPALPLHAEVKTAVVSRDSLRAGCPSLTGRTNSAMGQSSSVPTVLLFVIISCRIPQNSLPHSQITPKKTMPLNMTFQIFSRFLLFFLCLRFLIILQTCIRKILPRH